ncbi:hypothetical protein XELAEV_18006925mg [Xenopus laevis]|uniref:Uncharacterized protein n=1 Tax=Xenopus laevis TaxID=8355 RepID=A0A974E050_XENLA|nr:hypothetical protein XELAEV_18006925mg [Xenopus laevis]
MDCVFVVSPQISIRCLWGQTSRQNAFVIGDPEMCDPHFPTFTSKSTSCQVKSLHISQFAQMSRGLSPLAIGHM